MMRCFWLVNWLHWIHKRGVVCTCAVRWPPLTANYEWSEICATKTKRIVRIWVRIECIAVAWQSESLICFECTCFLQAQAHTHTHSILTMTLRSYQSFSLSLPHKHNSSLINVCLWFFVCRLIFSAVKQSKWSKREARRVHGSSLSGSWGGRNENKPLAR